MEPQEKMEPQDVERRKVGMTLAADKVDEIDRYAMELGMSRSAFMAMAVLIGARSIARQLMPEHFLTPDLLDRLHKAGFGLPEQTE